MALSLLQAFSELIVVVKVWEIQKLRDEELNTREIDKTFAQVEVELDYWLEKSKIRKYSLSDKFFRKLLTKK